MGQADTVGWVKGVTTGQLLPQGAIGLVSAGALEPVDAQWSCSGNSVQGGAPCDGLLIEQPNVPVTTTPAGQLILGGGYAAKASRPGAFTLLLRVVLQAPSSSSGATPAQPAFNGLPVVLQTSATLGFNAPPVASLQLVGRAAPSNASERISVPAGQVLIFSATGSSDAESSATSLRAEWTAEGASLSLESTSADGLVASIRATAAGQGRVIVTLYDEAGSRSTALAGVQVTQAETTSSSSAPASTTSVDSPSTALLATAGVLLASLLALVALWVVRQRKQSAT